MGGVASSRSERVRCNCTANRINDNEFTEVVSPLSLELLEIATEMAVVTRFGDSLCKYVSRLDPTEWHLRQVSSTSSGL